MAIVTETEGKIVEYKVDWVALADGVERLVMTKLADDLKESETDRSMRAMYLCDAGDSLDVVVELGEGNWPEAERRLWKMLPSARSYVREFIVQVAGKKFFEAVRKEA
jgi:hypothetical protein